LLQKWKTKQVRKIGILTDGFKSWGGGIDFLRMICLCIFSANANVEFHIVIVKKKKSLRKLLSSFSNFLFSRKSGYTSDYQHQAFFNAGFLPLEYKVTVHLIENSAQALEQLFHTQDLEIILPAIKPLSLANKIPWIGYIFDYQHKHLPELFSQKERIRRDKSFAEMLNTAKLVIVNSKAALADVNHHNKEALAATLALPFSATYDSISIPKDGGKVVERYGIYRPYFIICNQFWLHKNHSTAFEAFKLFADSNSEIDLICTGLTTDPRNQNHFADLMNYVETSGLNDRIRILGHIPKDDQLSLLSCAVALIQPTLFEGGPGGGAVYDAISIGVPAIVSDISVNLEIDDKSILFFKSNSAEDLMRKMHLILKALNSLSKKTNITSGNIRNRRRECGLALFGAIDLARQLFATNVGMENAND
jgi:glycosyltransferase involved in cell wall biosynthesis